MHKKYISLICAITTVLCCGHIYGEEVQPDIQTEFVRMEAQYGSEASNFEYTIPTSSQGEVQEIYVADGGLMETTESCHIRTGPEKESESITVLDSGAVVQVWGYTSNEWTRVLFKKITESDGEEGTTRKTSESYIGFIKSNLLRAASP